jgi:hypothetical protein
MKSMKPTPLTLPDASRDQRDPNSFDAVTDVPGSAGDCVAVDGLERSGRQLVALHRRWTRLRAFPIRACDKMIPMQNILRSQPRSHRDLHWEFGAETRTFWPVSFAPTV